MFVLQESEVTVETYRGVIKKTVTIDHENLVVPRQKCTAEMQHELAN